MYNEPILSRKYQRKEDINMTGYGLVYLLMQEIEKLKAELQMYKDQEHKN